jgi:hypothetical protein
LPEQSLIVWDLETVPDLAAAARMLDLPNATEAEVREALGSGFPKHPLHKIVCIGALVASRQLEGWRVDALGVVGRSLGKNSIGAKRNCAILLQHENRPIRTCVRPQATCRTELLQRPHY